MSHVIVSGLSKGCLRLVFSPRSSTPQILKGGKHSTTEALNHSLEETRLAELNGFRLVGEEGTNKPTYSQTLAAAMDCGQTFDEKTNVDLKVTVTKTLKDYPQHKVGMAW